MTEVSNVASTVLTTLDVGSGIDIVKLSEDLTNAEKEPKQNAIQGDKTQTSVDISDQRRLVLNRPGDEVFASVERVVDGEDVEISFFKVISDFAQALTNDDDDALALGLEEISTVTEKMGSSLADLGARMTTVDNQRGILEDTNLRYQDLLSNAQDLDYATAVTKLSAEILSLEAAQASFAKISQLSLFNYIR